MFLACAIAIRVLVAATPVPYNCITSSSTFEALVSCFDAFQVPHDFYTQKTFNEAQPTPAERVAWSKSISLMMAVDENCTSINLPSAIQPFYAVSQFKDISGSSYCVLHEFGGRGGQYKKGWGPLTVHASRSAVARHIHLSAPHPGYDLGTPEQAARLFKETTAKSVFIAGRVRTVFMRKTECIRNRKYWKTDPAHENVRCLL